MTNICLCEILFVFSYTEDYSGSGEFGLQSPTESLPSPVRPPLRHIDKYIKPEIPNLSKRYTIAILTCVGKYDFRVKLQLNDMDAGT